MSQHATLAQEMIAKIRARRNSYGSVLVKSAVCRRNDRCENIITQVLPLHKSDCHARKEDLDYGNLVLFEATLSPEGLVALLERLPHKGTDNIDLGQHSVMIEVEGLEDGYKYDSGAQYLGVEWFFERYLYRSPARGYSGEPTVLRNLPLFPDFRSAIQHYIGIDIEDGSRARGVLVCLPDYGARIQEVSIGPTDIVVRIEPKDVSIHDIVAKLYCALEKDVRHADIEFENNTGMASIGFKPESLHVALLSKSEGAMLDFRRYRSAWGLMPKGVVVNIPAYEIGELIRGGETETLEFKEGMGKHEEFAETVVAFANRRGGIVLLGVDDHSRIVGLPKEDYEDMVANVLRSRCEPQVQYELSRIEVEGKDIVVVRVEEGRDKPYFLRDRGPYVRAHATDRIATRYELDEMYREKPSEFGRR